MSSLSVEYLIKVKMVKLPGDDSKYVMMTVFRFFLKAKPKKTLNRPSLNETAGSFIRLHDL